MTETATLEGWVQEHNVSVTIDRERGWQIDGNGWEHQAYVLTLHVGDRSHSGIDYRRGMAYEDRSVTDMAAEVLYALTMDVTAAQEDFEDFAADYGYDTDSRKAYATWEACRATAEWLPALVGDDYETVLRLANEY